MIENEIGSEKWTDWDGLAVAFLELSSMNSTDALGKTRSELFPSQLAGHVASK
jgi:hypothetical protein